MNHLSLFTGAGGGELAHQHLLNFKTIGYVENNLYCTKILRARIDDGFLDEAPIFGDINSFIESGAAKKYKGYVDVVTAGFPCPAYSIAGRREGKDSEKNLWPQTLAVIRLLRPHLRYAFLENVPGLLTVNAGEMFAQILSDLAEIGFDARWTCLGADQCGAPHRRRRLWVLAYTISDSKGAAHGNAERVGGCEGKDISEGRPLGSDFGDSGEDVAHPNSSGLEGWEPPIGEGETHPTVSSPCWWPTEPNVGRVAHGVAHRVDRLKALGNGQVPRVAATAWRILNDSDVAVIKKTQR